ncbi:MAG: zinc-ribbon domain-containing protein, partial [Actinobacteria bacterium]|nr:zinc-ribbon domain-containing protein [Actinomycetota bacterium]
MAVCSRCGEENPERARFCLACGTPLEASPAPLEVRKTVTVLFCDVAGSTRISERLDPESLRRVMTRYFEAAGSACERHGGTVEKFIGDAVMAVFGIPVLHEDDALRAARAALELRETLAFLNEQLEREWGVRIEIRTGIDTGEVVAGDPSAGQRLVTGAPVVHAKRLEESAGSGEILLGRVTMRLLGDAVRSELVPPLRIKGLDDPIEA